MLSVATAQSDPWGCLPLQSTNAFDTITLRSPGGTVELDFIRYGGTAQRLRVPNQEGHSIDVLIGFDDGVQYCSGTIGQAGHPYFGAIIGRVANRISGGSFSFEGTVVDTPINEVACNDTLHGGSFGFDRRVWAVSLMNASAARLDYTSPAGEMGFPGELEVSVMYVLTDDSWNIQYTAFTTDGADTVCSLTQHSYWNLNGGADTITEHVLSMPNAGSFVEVDQCLLPVGTLGKVTDPANNFLDFLQSKQVGQDINRTTQYAWGTGYDNAWAFDDWKNDGSVTQRMVVFSPLSRIGMIMSTNQPSVQVYSGNFLNGSIPQKKSQYPDKFYEHWGAIVFEAQYYPDSPNNPEIPSIALKSGETYSQRTEYRFFLS